MTTKIATLDYLIFGKMTPQADTKADIHNFSYSEIAEHLKARLQLDFYVESVKLNQLDQSIFLSSSQWRSGDFVQYVPRSRETEIAHLSLNSIMLVPPILHDGREHELQNVTIIITAGQHNFKPYNSVTRFVRLPEPVAQLTELPSLINHLNEMYQRQLFRLNLVLDAGLLNGRIDVKQLSYLKTSFRQNFGEENCRLFVTNSRGKLGADGKAVTPFTTNHHEISAGNFINYLYDDDFKANVDDRMHEIELNKLMPYYQTPKLNGRSVVFLDSLAKFDDNQAEKALAEIHKAEQSDVYSHKIDNADAPKVDVKYEAEEKSEHDTQLVAHTERIIKNIEQRKTQDKSQSSIKPETKPKSKVDQSTDKYIQKRDAELARDTKRILDALAKKRQQAKERAQTSTKDDYISSDSPSDVIRRHMSASKVFNPRVQIINASVKKPEDDQKEDK